LIDNVFVIVKKGLFLQVNLNCKPGNDNMATSRPTREKKLMMRCENECLGLKESELFEVVY
jgi:hypothetical protein